METTFIFGINLLVAVPTTLRSVSLQATCPLKDYPCNIGGLSGRGIQLFADYSNQERIVQGEGVIAKVTRTVTKKNILSVCCELLLWKWKSFCR